MAVDRQRIMDDGEVPRFEERQAAAGAADMAPAAPETPAGAAGSEPPPSGAGDEMPDRTFPVPPVPPPPSPGPVFSLAGQGTGPTSFARPGTEAARPYRSPIFTANRSTGMPGAGPRFGAGTAVTAGAAPFLPAGLEAEGEAPGASGEDELRRILALMRGGGARG